MKLALIIDDYLPRSTRVGAKMFHELALELSSLGHNVTIITPDYQQSSRLTQTSLNGIDVWRFRNGPIKDTGKVRRAINELLLSFNGWLAIRKIVNSESFEGIVFYSPSIFWGGLISFLKKRCSCPSYLVLRDLFPQWVIDAGMIKQGSPTERFFRFFEHYSYKQANKIGLMSEKNLELFVAQNPYYPCEVLRNWASLDPSTIIQHDYPSVREVHQLKNKIIFFYGGNIGHAQDMMNLMRLVRNMQHHPQAHFLFVGQGDEVELIVNAAEEWKLSNFTYLHSVPQNEFKRILSETDVGLFSLSPSHTAHNFPGKLLGYMVESLPILGSVNSGNDLQDIVNSAEAGAIHINGEDDKLLSSAETLLQNNELRHEMGRKAFILLNEQFSVHSAAELIITSLRKCNAPG